MVRVFLNFPLLLVVFGVSIGVPTISCALPLEKFEHDAEVKCSSESVCARSLRSKTTLGSQTGIVVRGGSSTAASFIARGGDFELAVSGDSLNGLSLTWDSDTYPDQLSSAGLKCFDLKQDEGSAIVIEDLSIEGSCGEDEPQECPPFLIETRVYDAGDPTGQTYSASVLKWTNGKGEDDLIVPFSNFNRKGLRGGARFECVGAVSIQVKMAAYSEVVLSTGAIYTNSLQPLEPPSVSQMPSAPLDLPTSIPSPVVSPFVTPPLPPSPSVIGTIATTPLPGLTVGPIDTVKPDDGKTGGGLKDAPAPVSSPLVDKVVVAPLAKPQSAPEKEADDEVIYGEIIAN